MKCWTAHWSDFWMYLCIHCNNLKNHLKMKKKNYTVKKLFKQWYKIILYIFFVCFIWKAERMIEIFCPLVDSLIVITSKDWALLNSEVQHSVWISPSTWTVTCCLLQWGVNPTLNPGYSRMSCWCLEWHLNHCCICWLHIWSLIFTKTFWNTLQERHFACVNQIVEKAIME